MNLGLYLHIPFCHNICHYCDFAKTANFTSQHASAYLQKLEEHLQAWLTFLQSATQENIVFDSVFFGGGTPSMFSTEYTSLFATFRPHLTADAEISMEVNPDDISLASLAAWKELGVNRLSIGIQTFDQQGLQALKRLHDARQALTGLALATQQFKNVSADLIYGWPGHTLQSWKRDLDVLGQYDLSHTSLYTLMYESSTPLGRAYHRGRIAALEDNLLLDMYHLADQALTQRGFDHIEVSNWAKPGFICKHNWSYWHNKYYLGVGSGAHGFLPASDHEFGWRYNYPSSYHRLLPATPVCSPAQKSHENIQTEAVSIFHIELDEGRSVDIRTAWLTEYLLGSIRTRQGIDLQYIRDRCGLIFCPSPQVSRLMNECHIYINKQAAREYLVLQTNEWFRETNWILVLLPCFVP